MAARAPVIDDRPCGPTQTAPGPSAAQRGDEQTGGWSPCTALPSQQRDELALRCGVALDIALRHGQARMAGEFLDVPEAPADLGDAARGPRDEGPAPGMRRTAV